MELASQATKKKYVGNYPTMAAAHSLLRDTILNRMHLAPYIENLRTALFHQEDTAMPFEILKKTSI